jgi:hypothetical protein
VVVVATPVSRVMASRVADCTEDGDVSLKQSYARSFLDALSLRVSRLAHDFSLRIVTAMMKRKDVQVRTAFGRSEITRMARRIV